MMPDGEIQVACKSPYCGYAQLMLLGRDSPKQQEGFVAVRLGQKG